MTSMSSVCCYFCFECSTNNIHSNYLYVYRDPRLSTTSYHNILSPSSRQLLIKFHWSFDFWNIVYYAGTQSLFFSSSSFVSSTRFIVFELWSLRHVVQVAQSGLNQRSTRLTLFRSWIISDHQPSVFPQCRFKWHRERFDSQSSVGLQSTLDCSSTDDIDLDVLAIHKYGKLHECVLTRQTWF